MIFNPWDNYYIYPKCTKDTNPKLVLGVHAEQQDRHYSDGQAQLMVPDPADRRCSWRFRYATGWLRILEKDKLERVGGDETLILMSNAHLQHGFACITAPYANSPVVMTWTQTMQKPDAPGHTWLMQPHGNDDYFALQLAANPRLNLNVGGDGPYKAGDVIYAYSWGGGKSNELWQIEKIPPFHG